MPRHCVNPPNSFCYVCGELTFKSQRREFNPLIKKCYQLYFGCKVGDQDKHWAPHFICITCVRRITGWSKGDRHMNFAVPMIWREPTNHSTDCYFCLTNIKGITAKSKHTVQYPNLSSAMRPVPHSDELPVPKHPVNLLLCDDGDDDEEQDLTDPVIDCAGLDPTFEASCYFATPHLITK